MQLSQERVTAVVLLMIADTHSTIQCLRWWLKLRFGSFLLQKSWFWGKRPLTGKLPKNALPLLEGLMSFKPTCQDLIHRRLSNHQVLRSPGWSWRGVQWCQVQWAFRDTWTLNCVTNSNVHSLGVCFDFRVFGVFAQAKSHGGEMFLQSFEALNGQPWCQPPGLFPVS